MFTYLNRGPNQECVYNLIEQTVDHRSRGPPIYRSQFSCMVRQEADCAKVGCYKTMGVPKVCLCPPQNYLKKNSRAPITIKPPAIPRVKICSECPPPCCPPPSDPCASGADGGDNSEENDTTAGNAGSSCDVNATTCSPPEPCYVAKCRIPRLCCNVMKPPIPSPCVGFELIPRGCKNYIHSNVVKALRLPARKPALRFVDHPKGHVQAWCESGYPRKYVYKETFGCVPNYIEDIKDELYQNDMQAKCDMKFKERDIQAQIRHLEPTEHQALICGLKKNWEETFQEFQKLPLLIDTAGKIQKKKMLEDELKKLEKDIQTMERHDHVFVTDTCSSFYLA